MAREEFNKLTYIKQLAAGVGESVSRWNLDEIFNGADTPGEINRCFMEHLVALKTRRRGERESAAEGSSIDLRDFKFMTVTEAHIDALKATLNSSEIRVMTQQNALREAFTALQIAQRNYYAALAPSAFDEVPLKRDKLVEMLNGDDRIEDWSVDSLRRSGRVVLKVVVRPFTVLDNLSEARYRCTDPWFINRTELRFIYNGGSTPTINARAFPGIMYEGLKEMNGYCRYHFYVGHPRNPVEPHDICLGTSATEIGEAFSRGDTVEGVLKVLDTWTRYDADNPFVPFNLRNARFKYGENGTIIASGDLNATTEDLKGSLPTEFAALNTRYVRGEGVSRSRIPGVESPDWEENFFGMDYGMDFLWLKNIATGEFSAYVLGVPTSAQNGPALAFNFDGELVERFSLLHRWDRHLTDQDETFLKMGRENTTEALKDLEFVKWCARGVYTRMYGGNQL